MQSVKKIMFDTNAYDRLISDPHALEIYAKAEDGGYEFYLTHIQIDEINEIPDKHKEKRGLAILFLAYGRPRIIDTESMVLDVSRLDFCKFGEEDSYYNQLLNDSKNNCNDALIGETSIINGFTLVTDDKRLTNKILNIGGQVVNFNDFKMMLSNKWG